MAEGSVERLTSMWSPHHPITRLPGWSSYRELLVRSAVREFYEIHNPDHYPDWRTFLRTLRVYVEDVVEYRTGCRPRLLLKVLETML